MSMMPTTSHSKTKMKRLNDFMLKYRLWYNTSMKKDPVVVSQPKTDPIPASERVYAFFLENNIVPKVTVINELNTWVGDGYVLNDKPLLKVTYSYKE